MILQNEKAKESDTMKLVTLNEEEFDKFSLSHEQYSFYQKTNWGHLKELNGWKMHLVGYKKKDEIIAGVMILSKNTPIKKKMFYAPRGFLIDYKNEKLLKDFTKDIKKYVKDNNGFFIKIDPYIPYVERDIDANIVENGINNENVLNTLKNLGYKYYGRNKTINKELQPRWMFALDLDGDEQTIFNHFSNDTKRYIKRCEKNGLQVKEMKKDELDKYKSIMEHTAKRRGFIDRPISYYENMIKELKEDIKILLCTLDTKEYLEKLNTEKEETSNKLNEILEKLKENDGKKAKVQKQELEKELELINKRIEEALELQKKYGEEIVMSGSMFITSGHEIIYLFSGSYDWFMKYNPQYLIQWGIIKYGIKNKYKKYNFYGISGVFEKEDPMYGIYLFKRGFNGKVIELLGEFDLIVNPLYYYLYKIAFRTYKGIKHVKNKITK